MAAAGGVSGMREPWRAENLEKYDAVLFDCDGVLWRGPDTVAGAAETVARLRAAGKTVLFLTNNSTVARSGYEAKLGKHGISAEAKDVFSSSYVAAWHVAGLPRDRFDPKTQRALVVGGTGIVEELRLAGVAAVHLEDGAHSAPADAAAAAAALPDDIGAVVVGIDFAFTYTKAALAAHALLRGGGRCEFVATNRDTTFPMPGGVLLPGGGSCVAMVEAAAGRTAEDVGKPHGHMLRLAAEARGIDLSRTLMVGDRANTDILMGRSAGIDTLLVLSGVTRPEEVAGLEGSEVPHYVAGSVADMFGA